MAKPDLNEYDRKRDFKKSPEPRGDRPKPLEGDAAFVVHRHEATRLHYDLRLAADGVLISWAVPRGFSYTPEDKHLAVRTEDHPLEYEQFHGVIPKGQYGAGTMTIWDRGSYEVLEPDLSRGLAAGKLELRFHGRRLRGEWHMVETSKEKHEWLLFKARDAYARLKEESPYPFSVDLSHARTAAVPRRPRAMQPAGAVAPFSSPAWLFEMDFDGLRTLALKRDEQIEFRAGGKRLTGVPEMLTRAVARLHAENAVLDGVLVSLDDKERPSRAVLDSRLRGTSDAPFTYCVFDLLHYDAWDVRPLPLVARKQLLATLLPAGTPITYVEPVRGEGETLCRAVSEAGLPGVIAKESSSCYEGKAASSWLRLSADTTPLPSQGATKGALELLKAGKKTNRYGRVRVTNPTKVFWPEQGHTKADLVAYYAAVAEFLLPYLHERPLHMRRFPDGVGGKSFYHHNAPAHTPAWVDTETLRDDEKKTVRYIICNGRETLLYLANLGSIDLHPWLSQRARIDTPDWLVVDLDPDGTPFPTVVRVARALGKLLRGLGLRPYVKTSGSTGIHVFVPLEPRYSYDQARMFAEGVARYLTQEHPNLCTIERKKTRRGGRVYVDFLQNRRGQTVVPPYVVRPVPAASISTPLDWDELTSDLRPEHFTFATLLPRLTRLGDLFRGTLEDRQDLLPAIEALRERLG